MSAAAAASQPRARVEVVMGWIKEVEKQLRLQPGGLGVGLVVGGVIFLSSIIIYQGLSDISRRQARQDTPAAWSESYVVPLDHIRPPSPTVSTMPLDTPMCFTELGYYISSERHLWLVPDAGVYPCPKDQTSFAVAVRHNAEYAVTLPKDPDRVYRADADFVKLGYIQAKVRTAN